MFHTRNSNISHIIVRSIYKDSAGSLWVGTFDMLNKLLPNSSIFEVIDLAQSKRQNTSNHLILSIFPYSHENNSSLINGVIKVICTSNSGKVWLGTDFGLAEMDAQSDFRKHLHDPNNKNSITNSTVWDIFKDKSGLVWFGTNNEISILSNTSDRFRFFPMAMNTNGNIAGYDVPTVFISSYRLF